MVSGDHHGGESDVHAVQELEAGLIKEEGAAVGAAVALYVQARRPRFRTEVAAVAQIRQNRLEGVIVVIHFLQTHDVRSVGQNLLQDEVLPSGPAEGLQGTPDEIVNSYAQS